METEHEEQSRLLNVVETCTWGRAKMPQHTGRSCGQKTDVNCELPRFAMQSSGTMLRNQTAVGWPYLRMDLHALRFLQCIGRSVTLHRGSLPTTVNTVTECVS